MRCPRLRKFQDLKALHNRPKKNINIDRVLMIFGLDFERFLSYSNHMRVLTFKKHFGIRSIFYSPSHRPKSAIKTFPGIAPGAQRPPSMKQLFLKPMRVTPANASTRRSDQTHLCGAEYAYVVLQAGWGRVNEEKRCERRRAISVESFPS